MLRIVLDVKSSKLKRQLLNLTNLSAPLWFVKKSDRLQNLHRAIAPLLTLCTLRLCGSLKRAIAIYPECDRLLF
ncbi:MAG: hypothetical protein V7K25_08190 [Nostoc sp.]|uniref:hypothetical protein n=1 Tax=Nostoc sp. TaxID=1180 RepID=UPI002FF86995